MDEMTKKPLIPREFKREKMILIRRIQNNIEKKEKKKRVIIKRKLKKHTIFQFLFD